MRTLILAALALTIACSGIDARTGDGADGGSALHYSGPQRCNYAHRYRAADVTDGGPACLPLPLSVVEVVAPLDGGVSLWSGDREFMLAGEGDDYPCRFFTGSYVHDPIDGGEHRWLVEIGKDLGRFPTKEEAADMKGSYDSLVGTPLADGGWETRCEQPPEPGRTLRFTAIP